MRSSFYESERSWLSGSIRPETDVTSLVFLSPAASKRSHIPKVSLQTTGCGSSIYLLWRNKQTWGWPWDHANQKVFNRVFEGLEANAWSCKQVEQIISRLVRECRVYHGREMVFCLINLLLASPAFIHSGAWIPSARPVVTTDEKRFPSLIY